MTTATVHDISLAQLRKMHARREAKSDVPPSTAESIFSDMADGILALDFGLTFAGFEYEERQIVPSIVGLLGNGDSVLAMFDEQLAEHLKCSTRTVRRWRKAYIEKSDALNFGFLEIIEGEYISAEKRYQPTRYRFTDDAKAYVESTVDEARRTNGYEHDRRAAIEKAAAAHYEDVPQAPARRRENKPKRSSTLQIERDFINAKNNLAKGRNTLDGLPERARNVFLTGAQGRELRALLLGLQQQVQDILQDFPQTVDGVDVDYTPDILSGIPPAVSGIPHEAEDESARTTQNPATSPEGGERPATCVRPSSSYTRTQDLEAAAAWDRMSEKLRAPRAPDAPKVSKVELQIVAEPEAFVDDALIDIPPPQHEPEYLADAPPIETGIVPEITPERGFMGTGDPSDELTVELDPEDERERIAMQAIEYGYEFDAEGNIERIPPGVPDGFHEKVWQMRPKQEMRE